MQCRMWVFVLVASVPLGYIHGGDQEAADRGYEFLIGKAYLPPTLDQRVFDSLWRTWPEPLKSQAQSASPDERRRMAFERYGLTERPGDESGKPLQFVVDDKGNWTLNCFACHGGRISSEVVPGLPNAQFDFPTFIEEVRLIKLWSLKGMSSLEVGSLMMPLGTSRGTTNAVMFGVILAAYRDADLNYYADRPVPPMVHHDMDAPPWWHFKNKDRLYIDGFAEKGHRALMPFLLVKQNGPEKFRQWEDDYRDVFAFLTSVQPPKYPTAVDRNLSDKGRQAFRRECAECHGTYGDGTSYPQHTVPIDEIGTDRVRWEALSDEHRRSYGRSWFAHHGEQETIAVPIGYMAPPLDGIWASAPYFHNGSVPTLWHVLHPDRRPVVWKRSQFDYDHVHVGFQIEVSDNVPETATSNQQRRQFYDTRQLGKSAAGHRFPDRLDEDEKRAVLEYLKTL